MPLHVAHAACKLAAAACKLAQTGPWRAWPHTPGRRPSHWLPLERPRTHHAANLASQGKGGELAIVHALLVEVADVQLHAGMVLGRDKLVGPRAASSGGRQGGGRRLFRAGHLACKRLAPPQHSCNNVYIWYTMVQNGRARLGPPCCAQRSPSQGRRLLAAPAAC